MEWKYKIDLKDEEVFSDIEKQYGIKVPKEVRDVIQNYNAATPSNYRFMLGTSERVFGSVLSFNQGEEDTDLVFTALDAIEDRNLLPFAIDPFGNYVCYGLKEGKVAFWDHETGATVSTDKSIEQFLQELY